MTGDLGVEGASAKKLNLWELQRYRHIYEWITTGPQVNHKGPKYDNKLTLTLTLTQTNYKETQPNDREMQNIRKETQ